MTVSSWEFGSNEEHRSLEWIIQHKAEWGVANPKYFGIKAFLCEALVQNELH